MSEQPPVLPKSPEAPPLVRLCGISKHFGAVRVLSGVDVDLFAGEVHVLAGENGAGKSTLIKILGGVYSDYDGHVELAGQRIRPHSPSAANALGIAVIFQELSLVPAMSVADNMFLGRAKLNAAGFVRAAAQRREAQCVLEQFGLGIDPDRPVESLSIGARQMVEIAKAVSQNARVLVMDEPTSALNRPEVQRLFELISGLKRRGCAIVYITHKMEEIQRVADRITVLRDGRVAGAARAAELPVPELVRRMVGREIEDQFPRHAPDDGAGERLCVEGFSVFGERRGGAPSIRNVSFTAQRGQILGIGGLQGSGASQLFLGMFGAYGKSQTRGRVVLDGQPLDLRSPRAAIAQGVALVTSDRKSSGLVLPMSITANATLATLKRLSGAAGWRRPGAERRTAERMGQSLCLRAASLEMEVGALSGGNQQKVVLAKWLATEPKLLLLDEPTRGIDVGAKREIYQLMNQWTARGVTILLISSELPELLALSDRIIVLHRGELTAEFDRGAATPERVLAAAMGMNCTGEAAA